MWETLIGWFGSRLWEPHGHCFLWTPSLLWTLVGANLVIGAAYYSIPLALLTLVRKRRDLVHSNVFLLFAIFIFGCGTTHFVKVWTIWEPVYWLQGAVDTATATASILTAIVLWPLLPHLLKLPSPSQLETANRALQMEIAERREAEDALRWARDELERRVAERTQELHHLNERLQQLNESLEAQVAERAQQVQMLAGRLSLAEHSERQRISQILHDHVQQMLYGVQWRAFLIGRDLDRQRIADAQQHVADMRHLADEAVRAARQLTVELSPPILVGEGLPEAVGWLVNQMREIHNLKVSLGIQGDCHVADRNMRILLFQVIRELLFNVVKHAQVQEASVLLAETDRGIRVTVADAGVGFDVTALSHQRESRTEFGLATIRERVSLFDGTVAVDSVPGQGASIAVSLPL